MVSETERRKAAEEFVSNKLKRMVKFPLEIPQWLDEFAKEREDSALLEAVGLVCHLCKMGLHELKKINGNWEHFLNHCDHKIECKAGPIHERRAQKGNG